MELAAALLVVLLGFFWRLWPLRRSPHRGCDAYYFLLSREAFRRDKKIPIVLPPYYLLENREQWYPPGFSVFLALIPTKLLTRWYWCISPAVDAVIGGGVFLLAWSISSRWEAAVAAGLLYQLSPAAIAETQALTSRQLGSLLLNLTALGAIGFLMTSQTGYLVLAAAAGVGLLMTHKLSTQAFYLSFGLLALARWDGRWLLFPVGIAALTLLLSGGFYAKIVRSHLDFIRLWAKHWPLLGAHQVQSSPVYGRGEADPGLVYGDWRKTRGHLHSYLSNNVYVILCGLLIIREATHSESDVWLLTVALWAVLVWGVGLLSYVVPRLRGIGFMSQYGKLGLPAGSLCIGMALIDRGLGIMSGLLLVYAVWEGIRYMKTLAAPSDAAWDLDRFRPLLDSIGALPDPLIMCIPNNYCDLVAYHARVPVLWGSHTSPTSQVEPVLPVLQQPVEAICAEHRVTHVLVDRTYADPAELGLHGEPLWTSDSLGVYPAPTGEGA